MATKLIAVASTQPGLDTILATSYWRGPTPPITYVPPAMGPKNLLGEPTTTAGTKEGRILRWTQLDANSWAHLYSVSGGALLFAYGYVRLPSLGFVGSSETFYDWYCLIERPTELNFSYIGRRDEVTLRISRMQNPVLVT